ncbi:endogenous retrovirus group K member 19 Env polyprotein-like [Eptesicus fuscus]|uniref:endogenous retrovirus group K member 19 Env polyprotein-like n=1 Tax=Eptesicus fuscus TaxID=29078 RepID=UPI00240476E0|nr:endogenous retrovirus group K member 19 Env polyprotein-like [Eptesicus fuscus]
MDQTPCSFGDEGMFVFSPRMPKVRGGFRRGLCASQEMGELVKGVRQLTLQERPYNLAQTTRTAAVPTWGQVKKLAVEAEQTLIQTSTPKTGVSVFLAMMAILSCQVPSVRGDIHWAYVPDPPLLHPAEWGGPSVPVYVNDTHTLGMPSIGHIRPELHVGFNYFGQGNGMPICLSLEGDVTGCLQMDSVVMASPGWMVFLKGLSGKKGKVINITPPQDLPPCEKESLTAKYAVPWKSCHGTQAVQYVLPGTNFSIYDWSQPNRTDSLELGMYKGIWGLSNRKFQYGLWKLGASMDTPLVQKDNKDISRLGPESLLYTNLPEERPVIACVPEPYALLVGRINITFSGNRYQLQCVQCNLTNCVKNLEKGKQVAVVHQPSFVMVPVNLTGPWYSDKALQVWHEITGALSRPRRFTGLLVAGITALITLIASATAAAVALTQQVQTAHFVNNLSKNISQALGTQENIDRKIEEKLNALHDMVLYLGGKVLFD